MTGYLDHRLKGVIVPADRSEQIEVMKGSLRDLFEKVGWKYFSIVRTPYGKDNDFVMLVDEDGHQNDRLYNPRAQYLSGYPMSAPMLGDALFLSERAWWPVTWSATVSLSEKGQAYIQDPFKWGEGFKLWLAMNREAVEYYRGRWPGTDRPCEGHQSIGGTIYCDGICKK